MVTATRGAGAARMRNCIASYFWKRRNNELKWFIGAGTHKFVCHSHGSTKRLKISSGDGLGAELYKFHQPYNTFSVTWGRQGDPKIVISGAPGRFPK